MNGDNSYFESALCCLLEVVKLLCDPRSATVVSKYDTYLRLQPDETDQSDILTAAGSFMTSSTDYLWAYSNDQDRLQWEVEENHSLSCSMEIREADESAVKPVLVFGKHIHTEGGSICITEVIAVDVLRSGNVGGSLYFSALVRCSNANEEANSSTDRMYLLFVAVDNETPEVYSACALDKLLLFDQTPTSVRCIAHNLAVVSGTNGLLGLVKCNDSGVSSIHSLVEDNMLSPLPAEFVLSHSGDVTITAVDCVYNMGVDGCDITIVSGDSEGTVCMWRINSDTGNGYLLHKPYLVEYEVRRVFSLHLSPSSGEVAIGLCDRLLLLHYSDCNTDMCTPTCESIDVFEGGQALYGVVFEEECIRVWRVVDQTNSTLPGIAVTSWSRKYRCEQDEYNDSDTAIVMTSAEITTYITDSLVIAEAIAVPSDPISPPRALQLLPTVSESALTVDNDIIMDHHARHASHFASFGMFRPESPSELRVEQNTQHLRCMIEWYKHEHSAVFLRVKSVLAVLRVLQQSPSVEFLATILRSSIDDTVAILCADMSHFIDIHTMEVTGVVQVNHTCVDLLAWLCSTECSR